MKDGDLGLQNPNFLCTLLAALSSELLFGGTSAFSSYWPDYHSAHTLYDADP